MLAMCLTVSATEYTEGFLHYTISEESITITGYSGEEETVTIPAMIAGIPVNTIASGAFIGSGIRMLNLPDTITGVEGGAVDAGTIVNYNTNRMPNEPTQPGPGSHEPGQSMDSGQSGTSQPQPTDSGQSETSQPQSTGAGQPGTDQSQPTGSSQPGVVVSSGSAVAQEEYAIEEVEIELEDIETPGHGSGKLPANATGASTKSTAGTDTSTGAESETASSGSESESAAKTVREAAAKPVHETGSDESETEASVTEKVPEADDNNSARTILLWGAIAAVLVLGGALLWKKKK